MNPIPQQLLIYGAVLFLLGLLIGLAVPVLRNPRMGMSAHVAGMQSGMTLWALGLMWQHLALAAGMQLAVHVLAVLGLYVIFAALGLAALWGTSRVTPIAGAGHQGSRLREATVTGLMAGGSLAIVAAVVLVLWGLCAWKG